MKQIIFALFAIFVIALLPTSVYARQTTRVLQPGNVYEFTGLDARLISHVSTTGTGRYEIVAWNAQGEITRFGTAGGRFSVSGTGGVAITPLAPLSVTFDSSRLSVSSQSGAALVQLQIAYGTTANITNNGSSNFHVRIAGGATYNHAVFSIAGTTLNFARETRLPQISVATGGTLAISPTLGDMTVYFPARLSSYLTVASQPGTVLHTTELVAGQVYNFANNENVARTLRVDTAFAFEYILRGANGHVISHGVREGNQVQLAANQSITITPLVYATLFYPTAWDISIDGGIATPIYQTLQTGRTITVTNSDLHRSHNIFLRCPDEAGGFMLDYAIVTDGEVRFGILESLTGDAISLAVPGGAQATITIIESAAPLAVSLPSVDSISMVHSTAAAVVRNVLAPGKSVYISHEGEDDARVLPVAELATSRAVLDFVRFFDNEIENFGTLPLRAGIIFAEGDSARITNPSNEYITLRIPAFYIDNGLAVTATNTAALFRKDITSPVQIENRNRRYNHEFTIVAETGRNIAQNAAILDYVLYALRTDIASFGTHSVGIVTVPASRRMVIGATSDNITPTIVFPAEWYGRYLRITPAQEAPLHRITLAPGSRLTITNHTRTRFVMHNNSATTPAGFVFNYVRGGVNTPLQGPIDILPTATTTITATPGATLELWLPTRWARQLRIAR